MHGPIIISILAAKLIMVMSIPVATAVGAAAAYESASGGGCGDLTGIWRVPDINNGYYKPWPWAMQALYARYNVTAANDTAGAYAVACIDGACPWKAARWTVDADGCALTGTGANSTDPPVDCLMNTCTTALFNQSATVWYREVDPAVRPPGTNVTVHLVPQPVGFLQSTVSD